ncbi:MAG TPA: DNA recombination protein RmuC [Jatrophihabitantaceae bacterium]|nr:DNA recombination protein RmuC [Jatrophihabitantaceae bacterium]
MNGTAVLLLFLGLAAGFGIGVLVAARRREDQMLADGRVASLVGPLAESLGKVERQLAEVEKGRAVSDTALREQVHAMTSTSELLRTQTSQLVTALRAPQVRGRWGEMQLERVVEAAGMTEHVDYVTQQTVRNENGIVRPDLVVRLTGGKRVVVDSKVALSAYLEAVEAPDEPTCEAHLKAHARQLRTHIDSLAAKEYWARFAPTPEFVVCFVPADAILDAALREDPQLLEHAFGHNVVLATPSTLVALLRTVAYTWRQESLAANARQVHELGKDLYRRLATLGGHFDKLGRSLGSAVGAYNETVGSMERMVLSKARQLAELGVAGPDTPAPSVEPLATAIPRQPSAPEFTDSRIVALPEPRDRLA